MRCTSAAAILAGTMAWSACAGDEAAPSPQPSGAEAPEVRLAPESTFTLTGTSSESGYDLQAEVPIAAANGVITQTMEATWNGAIRTMEAPPIVPQGWTLQYFAGDTQLQQTPRTRAEWQSVTKIKTTGQYDSQGIENGRQILLSTVEAPRPIIASAFQGQSAGDGWNAFFDADYTKVYNIHHHSSPPTVMCRLLGNAQKCNDNYPLSLASGATNVRSTGAIDPLTGLLWHPTTVSGKIGWDCVDTATSALCSPSTVQSTYDAFNGGMWGTANSHGDPVVMNRKMYSIAYTPFEVRVSCLDMAFGEVCPGATVTGTTGDFNGGGITAYNGKIYALAGTNQQLSCFDTTLPLVNGNLAPCGGNWPVQTSATGRVHVAPSSDGVVRSVCADWQCFTFDGTPITAANAGPTTLPANYVAYAPNNRVGALGGGGTSAYPDYAGYTVVGTKVAWTCNGSQLCCWDMATDSKCSDAFPFYVSSLYAPALDPFDDNCIWTNGDDGVIRNWRIDTGAQGCSTGAARIQFKASVSIPRLGCDESSRVFEYRHFKLLTPTRDQYTSATYTIRDSNGIPIPGWINLPVPSDHFIDLTGLTVAEAGTTPIFDFAPIGLPNPAPIPSAELKVVTGSPPQMCWHLKPFVGECPDIAGFAGDLSTIITANANYSDTAGASVTYPTRTYDAAGAPGAPSIDTCAGKISGVAHLYTNALAAGIPIELLYGDGSPVLISGTNTPVTTMTGADGTFLFNVWGGFDYKVRAGSTATAIPMSMTVTSGGSGTTYVDAGKVTSPTLSVPAGGHSTVSILMWQEVSDFTLVGTSNDGVDCFTATVPNENVVGQITQSIDVGWDAFLRRLKDPPILPQGWVIRYFAGGSELESAPTSPAALSTVSRIVAEGTRDSLGLDASGRQIIVNTIDAPPPVVAAAFSGQSAGDGWNAFFDPEYTRVYNVHHHGWGNGGGATVMCRNLSDSQRCDDNWPINISSSASRSTGYIDSSTHYLWTAVVDQNTRKLGWDCIDLSTSARCDVPTVDSGFLAATDQWGGVTYDAHVELTTIGRKLYSIAYVEDGTARIMCLNMQTGQPCAGVQLVENGEASGAGLDAVGTKLFALAGQSGKLDCWDTAVTDANGTPTRCAGAWPVQTQSSGRVLGVPSSDGVIRSVCADWQCFTLAGVPITSANAGPQTLPPNYIAYHPNHKAGALSSNYPQYSGVSRFGPRIAWTCDSSWVCCWDMATDSTCSPAFPLLIPNQWGSSSVYAPTFDPEDDNCIWSNGDDGVIRNHRIDTGEQGCAGGPPKIQFKASVSIPRFGCDEASRVFEYREFKLIAPAPSEYTSAKLTIKDSNGVKIPGWTNIDIPANQTIDISSLSLNVAGTTPIFDIAATGLTNLEIIPRAELKVVSGGPPQVCWCLYPPDNSCPALSGLAINPDPSARDTSVTGDADYSSSTGQSRTYTHREYGTSGAPGQPPIDQCGGVFEGWAVYEDETPVAGTPIELLDFAGNPVIDPATGLPVTAITDANGYYSFGPLWGNARYKIRAGQSPYADPVRAIVQSGGAGSSDAVDLSVTSPIALLPRGGTVSVVVIMKSWHVSVIQQPNGTITCQESVRTNATFTCTATPAPGWVFATLVDNGANGFVRVVGDTYTSLPVGEDHIVTGSFRKDRGQECSNNADCGTGFCANGVCCNTACGGQCQACNAPNSLGTCAVVTTPQGNGISDSACNGVDDNCNGQTDEGYVAVPTTCGVGVCAGTTGVSTCIAGVENRVTGTCNPQSNPAYRANDICDGLDNNCNGTTDDNNVCPALDTQINTKPQPVTASTTATFTYVDTITATNTRFECALDGGAWVPCNGTGNGGGTVTYNNLTNGSHTFLVRAVGANGAVDPTPAFYSWVVDTSIPDTFVLSGPQNPSQSSTANFVFGSNVANPSAWFCAIDVAGAAPTQNQWFACDETWTWTNLAEGPHKIWVYVVNELGVADTTPATYSWVIDTVPPDTRVTGGVTEIVCAKTVTITFGSPDDAAVQAFRCRLDNADFAPCNSGTVTYNNLAEGPHTFQVAAIDVNGNIDPTPATATFTVDTVAPETAIDLAPLNPAQSGEATFVFSSNEAGSTFFCKLDGAANFTPCTSPVSYTGLADGTHTFQVYAADRGCKVDATPATWTWLIDTTYPETAFTKTPPIRIGQNSPNTFKYEDPTDPTITTFECQLDGGEWVPCDGGTSNLGTLELGTHTFSVRTCAEFGEGQIKCDPTPANYSWEVTPSPCPLDDVAPTITCAPDFVVECSAGGAVIDLDAIVATAEDDCEPVDVSTTSSENVPVGTSPIVFEATDGNGNTAFCVTGVTVADTKVPTITCEADKTVQAPAGVCGASVLVTATATDSCDSEGIAILGPSGSVDQPVFLAPGENSVAMTAIDKSGNKATCETKVTVVGVDKMKIECAAELTVDAPADFCGYPEAISADVKDVCASDVNVKSASDSFPIGVTNVTFDASNARGDTDTCTTKLTVRDVTAPTITCGIVDLQKLPAAFAPQASDACSATLMVSDVGCFQVDGSGNATPVTEGCSVAIRDGVAVAVTNVPVRNGAGAVIPTSEIRVQWKVTATDPTGNEATLDCSSGIDLSDRDRDRDGIVDAVDNCPDTPNADQSDLDQDGKGDICDDAPFEGLSAEGSGGCSGSGVGGGLALAGLMMVMLARRMRRVR